MQDKEKEEDEEGSQLPPTSLHYHEKPQHPRQKNQPDSWHRLRTAPETATPSSAQHATRSAYDSPQSYPSRGRAMKMLPAHPARAAILSREILVKGRILLSDNILQGIGLNPFFPASCLHLVLLLQPQLLLIS